MAVIVVFAIGLVVLVIVGDDVVQGETIVGGQEIDAGPRAPPAQVIDIARPGEAGGKIPGSVV